MPHLDSALELARRLDDKRMQAAVLGTRSRALVRNGWFGEAESGFAEARRLHELTGDAEGVALDYLNLGRTYLELDLLPVARTALDAGLAVAVQNQLNSQARGLHWTLGQLDDREGRLQAAHDHYAAAAEIVEQVRSQLRTE